MKALAVIPTIGASPMLRPLVATLVEEGVNVVLIDNLPADRPTPEQVVNTWNSARYLSRPDWRGIYRQWNLGMGYGALANVPTLVLNDDIVLEPGAATKMVTWLNGTEWAILGFDYLPQGYKQRTEAVAVFGTYRTCGVGGFAFGVNPRRCARVDLRFRWWGGDDDLVQATLAKGERVGLLRGAVVAHPTPSLSANANGDLLPEGWAEHDRALLISKWGDAW